jgi:hypothetical protein
VTLFSFGPHVYQATVVGHALDDSMVRHFHDALAVKP